MSKSGFQPTDVSFDHVVDMYLAEIRAGVPLSIELLATTFPHLADEIRTQLPTLALLEKSVGRHPATRSVPLGTKIGGCEVAKEIGRGAMGVVYEAVQIDLNRRVAVKTIPLDAFNVAVSERFEREAKAMARVEHPNITPIYSFGKDERFAYLVMKLIDGLNLHELQCRKGDYKQQYQYSQLCSDFHALTEMMITVVDAIHHAHECGLVHRDIKPANLLLDRNGKLWITDFGLAKLYEYDHQLSATGDAIGTPRYMAPEQVRGICDARSDVYSIGLTMYEIFQGQLVWSDQPKSVLLTDKSSIKLPDIKSVRDDIPDGLAKVIMKACEFNPEDRFQTASELKHVLKRFLDGESHCDRRKNRREPNEVFEQKRRTWKLKVASTALGSIAVGGLVAAYSGPKTDSTSEITTNVPLQNEVHESRATINLIDKLAESDSEDMVEIVNEFVDDTLDDGGKDLHWSRETKEGIREQVKKVTSQIQEDGGLNKESLNKFLAEYRQTSLPMATRIMRLSLVVQNSSMSMTEKQRAIVLLQRFAVAAVNNWITQREAEQITKDLTGRAELSAEELARVRVPDAALRNWLNRLSVRIQMLPAEAFQNISGIQTELERAVGRAMTDSE